MRKKAFLSMICGLSILFAGCSSANTSAPEETTEESTVIEETTAIETKPNAETTSFFKEIAGTYSCTAGTKGGTELMVSKDGSFTGVDQYYVTAVGDEEAPRGEFIFSKFSGTFKNVSKKDDHTYITEISDLTYQSPNGTEEIKNGMRIKYASTTQHLNSFERFEIYTPGKPVSELSTQCINWITWNTRLDNETQLERYVLNDIDSGDAFVGSKKETKTSPDSKLQSGLWLNYSIQSSTVETYEFLDDRIIVNEYTFANNTVKLSESTQYPQSKLYHKDGDSIVIESSDNTEMLLEPTEDENQLQYSAQKPYAREGVLYHRMYHHTELPSYNELVAESKNERNAILSRKG